MSSFLKSKVSLAILVICICYNISPSIAEDALVSSTGPQLKTYGINFTSEEKKWLQAHQEIRVAVRHGYSPIEFIFELQQFKGISIDYLKKLESILGIKFKKIMATPNIADNETDMISSVFSVGMLDGTKFTALKEPIIATPIAIFAKNGAHKIYSIQDLHGKTAAVFKSGVIAKRIAEDHPQIKLYLVDIAEEAIDAVLAGKADAYIGNPIIIKYTLKNAEIKNIEYAASTPYKSEVYMAVRNDWPVFKTIMNKGLNAITAQEKQQILDKWTKVSYINKINYQLIGLILSVFITLLSIFIVWNRRLKNEINQKIILQKSLTQSKELAEQAEETIRAYSKELEQLAMVAKHTTNSVIITDAKGLIVWINQAFTDTTGFTLADILGKKYSHFLQCKETSAVSIQLLEDAIKSFSPVEIDLITYKKNDEKYWINLKLTAVLNSSGQYVYIAVQTDITSQVNYIELIKNNHEDLNALFSLNPDGVVVLDNNYRISHVNEAFISLTGLDRANLLQFYESDLDEHLKSLCIEELQYKSVDYFSGVSAQDKAKTIQSNDTIKTDFTFQIKSNLKRLERSWIQFNKKRISRVIYFKDVTQKVIIENMQNEFITTAAHELRTPVTVILGYSELLHSKDFELGARVKMIDAIHRNSKQVSSLLDDLLDLATIENHAEKTLNLELQSLPSLMKSIVGTFIFAGNKNRILLSPLPKVPDFYFDSVKLERAIYNCLTNAYKFSPNTGIVKMRLFVTESKEPELAIVIQDQGIGMNAEQLSRVFEKFYRADKTGHIPGTGLGMTLVKDIIELHGGRVDIKSAMGDGTLVTLFLPIRLHS